MILCIIGVEAVLMIKWELNGREIRVQKQKNSAYNTCLCKSWLTVIWLWVSKALSNSKQTTHVNTRKYLKNCCNLVVVHLTKRINKWLTVMRRDQEIMQCMTEIFYLIFLTSHFWMLMFILSVKAYLTLMCIWFGFLKNVHCQTYNVYVTN